MNSPTPTPEVSSVIRDIAALADLDRNATHADVLLRQNERLQNVEHTFPRPLRLKREIQFLDFASFLEYLDEWMNDQTRVCVAEHTVCALFDAQVPGLLPSWEEHQAVFKLEPTHAFKMWQAAVTADGSKSIGQLELSLLFDRRAGDILRPDAATMMEIATTLEAKPKVSWKSAVRLQNGDRQFVYEETTDARAGTKGDIVIPESFEIGIALWEGCPPVNLVVKLRYRIADGRIVFTLEWADLEEAVKSCRLKVAEIVKEKLGRAVYLGRIMDR